MKLRNNSENIWPYITVQITIHQMIPSLILSVTAITRSSANDDKAIVF